MSDAQKYPYTAVIWLDPRYTWSDVDRVKLGLYGCFKVRRGQEVGIDPTRVERVQRYNNTQCGYIIYGCSEEEYENIAVAYR